MPDPVPGEDPRVCSICGEREPFHVHDGDRRIEDYFTVGRGMSDIEAARAWQARAVEAEKERDEVVRSACALERALANGGATTAEVSIAVADLIDAMPDNVTMLPPSVSDA